MSLAGVKTKRAAVLAALDDFSWSENIGERQAL